MAIVDAVLAFLHALVALFHEFGFMRRALVGALALALSSAPLGVFLLLRRMSLVADAMSHAMLPGAALGFILGGASIWALSVGGLIAALSVALLAGLISRFSGLKEEASFAGLYLLALAAGVLLLSMYGSQQDVLQFLFGMILGLDTQAVYLVASVASITLLSLAVIYRWLILETLDPAFLKAARGAGALVHSVFLALVVLNLVAGFQALGTLMTVGMMILPALIARLWCERLFSMLVMSAVVAMLGAVVGLLLAYYLNQSSGPVIILSIGVLYLLSLLFGREGGLFRTWLYGHHLQH